MALDLDKLILQGSGALQSQGGQCRSGLSWFSFISRKTTYGAFSVMPNTPPLLTRRLLIISEKSSCLRMSTTELAKEIPTTHLDTSCCVTLSLIIDTKSAVSGGDEERRSETISRPSFSIGDCENEACIDKGTRERSDIDSTSYRNPDNCHQHGNREL